MPPLELSSASSSSNYCLQPQFTFATTKPSAPSLEQQTTFMNTDEFDDLKYNYTINLKKMDRIQFSSIMPRWLYRFCDTVPKVINNLLFMMGIFNVFLLVSVFQATILPNLGISPTFLAFLLCMQNGLTWFALNNHRLSHLPTLVADDFVIGCLLGICVGGSIVAFVMSQFFGRMSNCVSIQFTNYDYECKHQSAMLGIWFWSGLVFWVNTIIAVLIVFARDDLSFLQHQNYENIGLALEELENNFQRNAVYTQAATSGDGTYFGSSTGSAATEHESLGEAAIPQYPTTPSQEQNSANAYGGYGADVGFDGGASSAKNDEAQILTV